jgi:RNA polymerase sigma-70 factor (ECF subfamily)
LASPIKISPSYFPVPPVAVAKPRPVAFPRDQIAAFYLELRAPLCASLRRWNLPAEEVEDIVQDAFVRLLSHGPEDLKAENARYWLFRVAHNLAIDRQRSGWRSLVDSRADFDLLVSVHPSPNSNPEKIYLHSEQWRVVQHNLAKLTPRQRHAIHLRITGFTYEAIAQQLKGTTSSVAELIRRGLKRLGGIRHVPHLKRLARETNRKHRQTRPSGA